ncbi:uncharacterized protein LOC131010215 [Salvia miltiorrhiza]|uniref:uncharacterized protein LOC131010215 n=1 Tax=Salvia miltiorrhiza TaxID=226208 RepID=UPI0025AD3833|nr:uncharacterized protein LOC131010215 [Salvia miltiorrhiza]
MMNFVALGLVLTSLVTAGFFAPTPQNPRSRGEDDVIVKEGHRVVMVEYEKDDGNTKVLISPQEKGFADKLSQKTEKVKEGVKGASSSVVDELGNLVGKNEESNENILHKVRPRELVCDAYGKCKHKIASAFEKTKASAAEAASAAEEAAKEAVGRVKDKLEEGKEMVKDSASELSSKAAEGAKEAEAAKEAVSEKAEGAKEAVSEKTRAAKEAARGAGKRGKKELREILRHAGEVAGDAFEYVVPRERVAPVAGVAHLMGFAAAYGMCVWMTFASSYVLARALPRQQFALVQSKIYPVYFKGMGCCVGMALLGHLVGRPQPAVFQGINLSAALAMILTNLVWLEPQATKVMLERMKKEKEEGAVAVEASRKGGESVAETAGRGASSEEIIRLRQRLERLNSYSSFLNALTLVSLTWHLVHLSRRLMC